MSTKKIVFFVVTGLLLFAGLIYFAIWELVNNLMFGFQIQIDNPLNGLLTNQQLTGTITLSATNPTPFSFRISSIYASVCDPSGTVLTVIDVPAPVEVIGNGTTAVTVPFSSDMVTDAASIIAQLIGGGAGATVQGKVYFLGGLVWYSFSESASFKV